MNNEKRKLSSEAIASAAAIQSFFGKKRFTEKEFERLFDACVAFTNAYLEAEHNLEKEL